MEGRGGHRGVRAKGFPPAEGREPPAPPARHAEFLSKSYVPSASSPTPGDVPRSEREAGASTSTSWAGQLWKQYDPINRLIFPGVGVPATYDDRGAPPRAAQDPSRSDRGGGGSDRGVRVSRARRDVASSGVPRAPLASHSLTTLTTLTAGKPFVGELQVRDVVYKTIVVKLPALVPGGLCAPPTRVACPCLVVLRADVQTLARCRGRGVILYLHGNGTDIGGAAEEAKTLARVGLPRRRPRVPRVRISGGDSVGRLGRRRRARRREIHRKNDGSAEGSRDHIRKVRRDGTGGGGGREALQGCVFGAGGRRAFLRIRNPARERDRASLSRTAPAALALHSPYTSIFDFAREKAGHVLSWLLVTERWPTMRNMTRVACPTLLIHGDCDEVIPARHSSRLRREAKRFPAPCQLHVQRGASHNVFDFFGDVADPLATFLRRHERAPWGKAGARREPMGLDLRDLERKVRDAGEGDAEEYPFADAGY